MNHTKEPLYRKVNTKARGVHHFIGGDAKHDRNSKAGLNKSMKQGKERGLDYAPLYRFLHSKVGKNWDDVYSEAKSRLPNDEAIFHIVQEDNTGKGYVTVGEASYLSSMYVDESNLLQFVRTDIKNEQFYPACNCCTHTFNGKVFINKYNDLIGGKAPE